MVYWLPSTSRSSVVFISDRFIIWASFPTTLFVYNTEVSSFVGGLYFSGNCTLFHLAADCKIRFASISRSFAISQGTDSGMNLFKRTLSSILLFYFRNKQNDVVAWFIENYYASIYFKWNVQQNINHDFMHV